MVETADIIWADGPARSPFQPPKPKIRAWGKWIEGVIAAFLGNSGLVYTSRTALYADLAHPANSSAWVIGDATALNNGVYMKTGASGVGSWSRVSDLPFSFIVANDAGAGTPNAIQATTSIPVSGSALVWMNIADTNTGSPVTVQFNGGAILTVKTNTGNNVAASGLVAGMIVIGIVSGSAFRLLSDQVSSAIVAAAEAAQAGSEAARDAAREARDIAVAAAADAANAVVTTAYTIKSPTSYLTTARTSRERFQDYGISLLDGGGSGGVKPGQGDANADTAALLNLGNDLPSVGGTIRASASRDTNGVYLINDRLSIDGKRRIAILGDSMARSVLRRVSGGTHGLFHIEMDTPGGSPREIVEISGLTLEASTAINAPAIELTWDTAVGTGALGCNLRNLIITSDEKSNQTKYWNGAIRLVNARESNIDNIDVQGPDFNIVATKYGVSLEGGCVGIHMRKVNVYHAFQGIFAGTQDGSPIAGECEGIYIHQSQFVTVDEGVVCVQNPNELGGHTMVAIDVQDCHSNAHTGFFRGYGVADVHLHHNQIQKRDESTKTYRDIDLMGYCDTVLIDKNSVRLRGTGGTESFVHLRNVAGIAYVAIEGNIVHNRDYLIECAGSTATNIELRPNTVGSDVTNILSGTLPISSTTRFCPQSKPRGTADTLNAVERPFTLGDTSPSVVASLTNRFRTGNSSATTITQFDDGYEGQEITVRANDANTTIQHSSNIILKTGANTLMTIGGVMKFWLLNGNWIETQRTF